MLMIFSFCQFQKKNNNNNNNSPYDWFSTFYSIFAFLFDSSFFTSVALLSAFFNQFAISLPDFAFFAFSLTLLKYKDNQVLNY